MQGEPTLPVIHWLPNTTVLGPGPLRPCTSPFRPQLTWWRAHRPGPAGLGAPSIVPCRSVLGTCPLAASLAPGGGHWPGSHGSEALRGLPTLDHTWPCSAPVGFNQSWITMAYPGRHLLERRWDQGVSDSHTRVSGLGKSALYRR